MAVRRRRYGAFKRYARSAARYAGSAAMARYGTPGGIMRLQRDVATVKQLVNTEFKEKILASSVNPTSSGNVLCFNLLAQGDDKDERGGNSVRWKSVFSRITYTLHASATTTVARAILLWDRQSNGALPSVTDVLQAANVRSSLNTDNSYRFKVISDQLVNLHTSRPITTIKTFRKLNRHQKYTDTTGVIGSVATNSLLLLTVSDQATNSPTVQYNIKSRFIDN